MKLNLHAEGVGKNPKVGSNAGHREAAITPGGIETNVAGFFGDITKGSPVSLTYGAHKKPYSENAPTVKGGRKGAKTVLRNKYK